MTRRRYRADQGSFRGHLARSLGWLDGWPSFAFAWRRRSLACASSLSFFAAFAAGWRALACQRIAWGWVACPVLESTRSFDQELRQAPLWPVCKGRFSSLCKERIARYLDLSICPTVYWTEDYYRRLAAPFGRSLPDRLQQWWLKEEEQSLKRFHRWFFRGRWWHRLLISSRCSISGSAITSPAKVSSQTRWHNWVHLRTRCHHRVALYSMKQNKPTKHHSYRYNPG